MLYAFLGWNRCGTDIERFENCKKTGIPYNKDPTECYNEAKTLQQCYGQQAYNIYIYFKNESRAIVLTNLQ